MKQAVKETTDKVCMEFQTFYNAQAAPQMPVATKASSGATGLTAMEKFDWTRDKGIYQQWQVWSTQAKHAMNAMEGDREAANVVSTIG